MKFELALRGQSALVVPNGIPARLLDGPPAALVRRFREALDGLPLLVKVGRFDADKRWLQAIDAVAELHAAGYGARLVIRGGRQPYAEEVYRHARARGLSRCEIRVSGDAPEALFAELSTAGEDIVDLQTFLPEEMLQALYVTGDAVLANSGKEPFGLVGLEVMAAGGLAVCGATGEEYAEPFVNAIVVDTDDGRELAAYLRAVVDDPATGAAMRAAGQETAERYTWPTIIETLTRKLAFVEELQGG